VVVGGGRRIALLRGAPLFMGTPSARRERERREEKRRDLLIEKRACRKMNQLDNLLFYSTHDTSYLEMDNTILLLRFAVI
tara:strand:+ start:128 stop:367 length:240 start_codon:yes stop_codon:yes gene_type:complete